MEGRPATVKDVAEHVGVSTATVSRVMSGAPGVTPATKDRVLQGVEDVGYRPMPAARNLRQQRTRTVALIVPSITNPFFPELVEAIHREVRQRGYLLLLTDTDRPEEEAARVAEARIADGILLVGDTGDQSKSVSIRGDMPVVAFDRAPASQVAQVVQCDNANGAATVVEHLLARGRRRIAHITGPEDLQVARDRTQGYRDALQQYGITVDPTFLVTGDFFEDSGYEAAHRLVTSGVDFDAIFAANDMMAIGAITALRAQGLEVPDDVAVAGFDGVHLGKYVHPTLTTYSQPVEKIARHATGALIDAIEHMETAATAPGPHDAGQVVHFTGELTIRESSAAPPHAFARSERPSVHS